VTGFIVREARAGDEAQWRRLWLSYCDFYAVTVAPEATAELWRRIMDESSPIHALVAEASADAASPPHPAGFANYVLHPYTWGTEPICYLEDLFVEEGARGARLGGALIQALIGLCEEKGWPRLYWHTHQDNQVARSLYDKFAPVDPFVRYVVRLR
jgi:GNAT superfamily N-acetyltransferase